MKYELSQLSNGARVLTVPMKQRESVGVAIWVRTGSRFEPLKLSGVSHYLEHMLFKGTKKRTTRQIKEAVEGVGGMLNAFTSEEATCYFAKLLKPHYPKALDVLSDMVNHATLVKDEFDREKTVILEEIKMYKDLPAQHVHDVMGEMLWPKQPLGRPIAGTIESVSALTRNQVMDYKLKYYQPKNILVSVSGDVEHSEVLALVKKQFKQKASKTASTYKTATVNQQKAKTLFLDKKTEQTHFVIGMHTFSRFHPDRYKLGLLNVILGANMSSRLFEEVREKRGLAYEIRSGLSFFQDTGSISISAGVETKKAPLAMQVILRELAKLKRTPVKAGELRRAKDYFTSQLAMALEDTLDHLLWVGERVLEQKELPKPEVICNKIEHVTTQDIQKIAKKIFQTKHLNLALIGPVTDAMKSQMTKDLHLN